MPLQDEPASSETVDEQITFEEVPHADQVDIVVPPRDPTFSASDDGTARLGDFLNRPVKIDSFLWNEGDAFTTTPHAIYPWDLYFYNSYLKNKLQNYARIQCKLKVTIRFTASPFYYGHMRVFYDPLDSGRFNAVGNASIINQSTAAAVDIMPQYGSSVDIVLPFVWASDWLNTGFRDQFKRVGKLYYQIFVPLRSANGVTGTGITITTYAEAVDLKVCGPTVRAVLQSGMISAPAAAVSKAAGAFTGFGTIGPYAKAISLGAGLVSKVAAMFGFSNAPNTEDVRPVQNKAFHAFANVETSMPIDKLAIDPKNEVTLDNRVCGSNNNDELIIADLVKRETCLGSVDWSDTAVADTRLAFGHVSPATVTQTTLSSSNTCYHYSTMGWVAKMFRYWRGSIRYHFRVVRSRYQKGRIMFQWDPNIALDHAGIEAAVFTKVFDLSSEEEGFEVVIPYKACELWKQCVDNISAFTTSSSTLGSGDNGGWQLVVVNPLTGPALSNTISIECWISGGEDLIFAAPSVLPQQTTAVAQSGLIDASSFDYEDHLDDITVGEKIASLRALLHRATLGFQQYMGYDPLISVTAGMNHFWNLFPRLPPQLGFMPANTFASTQIVSILSPPTLVNANFATSHPIHWVLAAFAGYRGSIVVHANITTNGNIDAVSNASISRTNTAPVVRTSGVQLNSSNDSSTLSSVGTLMGQVGLRDSGAGGMVVTNGKTQLGLSAVIPQYNQGRFYEYFGIKRNYVHDTGYVYDGFRVDMDAVVPALPSSSDNVLPKLQLFYAAGVDFNPVHYVGIPHFFAYTMAYP